MIGRSRARFAAVPEWVLTHRSVRGKSGSLLTYTGICMLANYRDRTGDPDWQEISRITGQSRTAIYRALGDLRDAGIIVLREDGMYDLPLDPPVDNSPVSGIRGDGESHLRDSESHLRDETVPLAGFAPLYTESSEVLQSVGTVLEPVDKFGIDGVAEALARYANEQPIKPSIGRRSLLGLITGLLRCGYPPEDIRRAVEGGRVTWSDNGLRTAINQARTTTSHRRPLLDTAALRAELEGT